VIRKLFKDHVFVLRVLQVAAFGCCLMNAYNAASDWWQRESLAYLGIDVLGVLFMGYLALVRYPKHIAKEKRRVTEKKIWEATVGGWDREVDHDS
jgi:hypothetical protein